MAQVERVMPDALRERVRDLEETVTPAVAPPAKAPSGEVVLKVASAVRGSVILRCLTSDLGWLARVLSGLSCPFVVRRPTELR